MDPRDLPPPSKSWGQNYLKNRGVIRRIVKALGLVPGTTVIEIGPGRGALTEPILNTPGVIYFGIEPHPPSREYLMERFGDRPDTTFLPHDASKFDFASLSADVTVGNLPYNVAARILHALLKSGRAQRRWVLMFQKEMAQRIVSAPNNKSYGALSVGAQMVTEARLLFNVSPGSFSPAPKVDSSVVQFTPRAGDDVLVSDEARSFLIQLFSSRRKTMRRALGNVVGESMPLLTDLQLDPTLRPENISPDQFKLLISAVLQYKRL